MKPKTLITTATLLASAAALAIAAPAHAERWTTTTSETVTSQECLDQLASIAKATGKSTSEHESSCVGTITLSESAPVRADLSQSEHADARRQFAGPWAYYRDWTHTYWGGSIVEIHKGRTWWDGDVAWISTYDGYTGSHSCHAEGSWTIGWVITPYECTRPGAGNSADAFHRFDAALVVEGSWVTLGVGLHYSTNAAGGTTSWQVGG